ncbi:MAG: HDOD domain-containing protein [Planctomycetes bacterium]|nr:HDOD domain-containing protein [Planctomycetota bacterium]
MNQQRRVELILQQLDQLPTLSSVAIRLLDLTAAEDSDAKDVIGLVSSDPALCSKVLKLCRCMAGGRARQVTTIDRAVVLVGFDALRSAVLSVQVFEIFDGIASPGGEQRTEPVVFDRQMFWHHSLAVAVVCEHIAASTSGPGKIQRSEAFTCGLLHDLGLLALHVAMPKGFDRVCELAESHGKSLDHACRRIIGIGGCLAGKRLAEHWQLPQLMIDVIWLHGQPVNALPDGPNRPLIALVSLADAIARRQHLTPAGHAPQGEDIQGMCDEIGLEYRVVAQIIPRLHDEVAQRAEALGMGEQHSVNVLLQSICRANEVLGRSHAAMLKRAASTERQSSVLEAITKFHDATAPRSVEHVLGRVVESARSVFGDGPFSVLYQGGDDEPCQVFHFSSDGRLLRSRVVMVPAGSGRLADLDGGLRASMRVQDVLPWLGECLSQGGDQLQTWVLPLPCSPHVAAALLHDRCLDTDRERKTLEALLRTWGAAVDAAAEHQSAGRLAEQFAQANRTLAETRDTLAQAQALASLGELAAGAAHEMNNPLAIISGRSQLLAGRSQDPELKVMAEQIVQESHHLSDMITALRDVAEPAITNVRLFDLAELLHEVVRKVSPKRNGDVRVKLVIDEELPPVCLDSDHIAKAVHELLRNALEAQPSRQIELQVHIDPLDDRLMIRVTDDGPGLSDHTLAHAFDPFFSDKPAGRGPGLGLAIARRLVEAHRGRLTLENAADGGAVATIWLGAWRGTQPQRGVA